VNTNSSVLHRTGQAWKFWIMPLCVMISVLLVFGAQWYKDLLPERWYRIAVYCGLVASLVGVAFPAIGIRCPRCGAHWLWLAMTKGDAATWWDRLVRQQACSRCGFRG
jgi:hypothetical protein